MSAAHVAAEVMDTASEWMTGYTDSGPQRRVDVDVSTYDPPVLVVAYRSNRYAPAERAYRVTLTVEEIDP